MLHIAPGWSAAGLLRRAFGFDANAMLVNDDYLSCGPLPRLASVAEWQAVRAAYRRELLTDDALDAPDVDLTPDLRVLSHLDGLSAAERVTLWVGVGLTEQLLLAWTVELYSLLQLPLDRLRVIQFERDPTDRYDIEKLGILPPDALRQHPAAVALDAARTADLRAGWRAATASDPQALIDYLEQPPNQPNRLHACLPALLQRYPDIRSGLSRWDAALLSHVAKHGPKAVRIIGHTLGKGMDLGDWVGDDYLLARLRRLGAASLAHPAVAISGPSTRMRDTRVALTDVGREILAGSANFVALNGIDDWVGGVHLDSTQGRVWFRRDGALVRAG
jgi:hypothetical protein